MHAYISILHLYVNDYFALLNSDDCNLVNILYTVNSINEHIPFTSELENNNRLPFLDVWFSAKITRFTQLFTLNLSQYLSLLIVFHPIYLNKSCCLQHLTCRTLYICSADSLLRVELDCVKSVAINRGFAVKIVHFINIRLRKRITSRLNTVSNDNLIILPYFLKISHQISKILFWL